ncbi:MAG: helix-turn-helix transcriptional regulator [Clostridia bacterium]|nr:helix-turn-helix transcriptional regulator [Clostridia bacterium]
MSGVENRMIPTLLQEKNIGILFPLTEEQAQNLRQMIEACLSFGEKTTVEERELMFYFVLNRIFDFCPEEKRIRIGIASTYIQEVLQYLAENYTASINVEQVAARFAISVAKLNRDFRTITGLSVHRFVELCRLNQAKYLLRHCPDITVGKIAEKCGFATESYFFPFFKRHAGITPVEFRRRYKKLKSGK